MCLKLTDGNISLAVI